MKTRINYVFYIIFIATLSVIGYEMISVQSYHNKLTKGDFGLPNDSSTVELASEKSEKFIESQLGASHIKMKSVFIDLLKNSCFVMISLLFLNPRPQEKMLSFSEKQYSIVKRNYALLQRHETIYISFIAFLYSATMLLISFLKSKELDIWKLVGFSCLFVLSYYLLFPVAVFILYSLLECLGKGFIVGCYVAFALKVIPEIIMEDIVDDSKMVNMKIEEFPKKIQDVLYKYDLQDVVYKERTPGKETNAALIGYGSKKRMEVYGDISDVSKNQLYAILLHEVGHVDEHSLVRKSVVYFVVLSLECAIILLLYHIIAPKYASPGICSFTSFVILVFIYRILIRQWLTGINKITSQLSEINSDLFTIQHGYNENLAATLFNIGVEARDYLYPTTMYNSLRSTHPSIYSRVEYLKQE